MSAAEELHNRGVRIEELRAEITHLKYERQEIIDNALAEKAELVAALEELAITPAAYVRRGRCDSEERELLARTRAALADARQPQGSGK